MRSGDGGVASVARLWWTVPVGLVLLTGIVFVAVILPTLASAPDVPTQLVVNRSPTPSATATSRPASTPSPHKTSASPAPLHSMTVVVPPAQPVVRESEDGHDDAKETASGEPSDR